MIIIDIYETKKVFQLRETFFVGMKFDCTLGFQPYD